MILLLAAGLEALEIYSSTAGGLGGRGTPGKLLGFNYHKSTLKITIFVLILHFKTQENTRETNENTYKYTKLFVHLSDGVFGHFLKSFQITDRVNVG